jgi:hypothetical protein
MYLITYRQKSTHPLSVLDILDLVRRGKGEGGEGGVRGGVEKKEEELKEQMDMKFSTKFQINQSTNG